MTKPLWQQMEDSYRRHEFEERLAGLMERLSDAYRVDDCLVFTEWGYDPAQVS